MPLTIVPPKPGRTPNYHIRGTYLGIPVNRSAGTPDRRLATQIKKRIEQEIEAGTHAPSGALTFVAVAVAYMKAGGDRTYLGPIIEYDGPYAIRDRLIETIVQQDLDHLADALYPSATPQTRNRQVYTPVIAVLRRSGVERRFHRPKGWRGKKSKSFLEPIRHSTCSTLREAGRSRIRSVVLYASLHRAAHWRSAQPGYQAAQSQSETRHARYLRDTKNGEPVTVHLPPIVVEKFKAMPPRPYRPSKITARGPLRNRDAGRSQLGAGVPFLERDPNQRLFRFHQGGYLRRLLADAMKKAGLSFPRRQRRLSSVLPHLRDLAGDHCQARQLCAG